VAVIAAIELEDPAAAIARARDAHRGRDGLRAAHDEAHQLRVREGREHSLGELALAAMRRAEGEAVDDGALHRIDDARVRVAEDQRAPRHAEIEVAVAVLVHDVRAFRLTEEDRRPADLAEGAYRARDTGGYQRFSARIESG
jgi:hypothetical protein